MKIGAGGCTQMSIELQILEGPLDAATPWHPSGAGAVICFEGVVRPTEQQRALVALEYEVYEPMTHRELKKLAQQVVEDHGLLGLRMAHSRGQVRVGACSFRLQVAAAHRKEALAAMDVFIDRMKQVVPIWKVPVWAESETPIKTPTQEHVS